MGDHPKSPRKKPGVPTPSGQPIVPEAGASPPQGVSPSDAAVVFRLERVREHLAAAGAMLPPVGTPIGFVLRDAVVLASVGNVPVGEVPDSYAHMISEALAQGKQASGTVVRVDAPDGIYVRLDL